MSFLLKPNPIDSGSVNGPCTYPAKPVKSERKSPNVYFEGKKVEYCPSEVPPDTVPGLPTFPGIPCPVPTAVRKVVCTTNVAVHINGSLFAVQGDETILTSIPGTPRKFVAPFQYLTIHVANSPT